MKQEPRGLSAKRSGLIMSILALLVSALLIVETVLAHTGYSELRNVSDHFIQWQRDASELQDGSDRLTEQVRCFVETGNRMYLDGYFEEANVTKQRDKAVHRIHEYVGETPAYDALVAAMGSSVALMDREYYAMRLKLEACGEDLAGYPEVIRGVQLSERDAALSPAEKDALARSMVFDETYRSQKETISGNVQACLAALTREFEARRSATVSRLNSVLFGQMALIILSIVIVVAMLVISMLLVVRPLNKAVLFVREEKKIPPEGASEIRFLAETYNAMYETSQKQKQSITSLLNHMPAMSFSKDAETGVYLACNKAFAAYAQKTHPNEVVGLTDEQIFDAETARTFVEDDRMALSMDKPYVFSEDVTDAAGNPRQLQTTKLKYTDSDGRLCILGMCADVTDMVRIRRENATTKEAYEKAINTELIYSRIAQTLAASYMELFYINTETEKFIEYLTDAEKGTLVEKRRGSHFFEQISEDAKKYVHPEDQPAFLASMDRKTLMSTLDRDGAFILAYRVSAEMHGKGQGTVYVTLKITRMKDDRKYIVLAVTNTDEQMKERKVAERVREQQTAYRRINALTGDFLCVYVVDPTDDHYREFSSSEEFGSYELAKEGQHFFETTRASAARFAYPDDLERFLTHFTKEAVLSEIEKNGIFAMSYRLVMNGRPIYVRLKAAMVEENNRKRLIVGINDIDSHVKQEHDYEQRLARAQSEANIDALTGIKNKHAYMEAEKQLNAQIRAHQQPDFAVIILDINNLKTINDTEGHHAGDRLIREACGIICNIFKHSPVFRIGGDEFAVIARNRDLACIEELLGKVDDHNEQARRTGGVIIACGMSRYQNDKTVAPVFERADENMYKNKNTLKGTKT